MFAKCDKQQISIFRNLRAVIIELCTFAATPRTRFITLQAILTTPFATQYFISNCIQRNLFWQATVKRFSVIFQRFIRHRHEIAMFASIRRIERDQRPKENRALAICKTGIKYISKIFVKSLAQFRFRKRPVKRCRHFPRHHPSRDRRDFFRPPNHSFVSTLGVIKIASSLSSSSSEV